MTVSTEVDHNDYTGNGVTTSFPYTFRIFKKSDLTVQVADLNENITVLTLDTDYSVTGAGTYSGGNVVLMSPLANGWQISISRDLPVTQETDLRNQGKFFAEVHEDAFDKLTMLIQQCFSFLRLALRKPSFIANYYDALDNRIRNLRDPSQAQDAATKNYVDNRIVDNTNAWKEGDRVLDQKIDANFRRTIRVPEENVNQLNPIPSRRNSLFGWDSNGQPIPVFSMTDTADLAIKLASHDDDLGGALVGLPQGGTVNDALFHVINVEAFKNHNVSNSDWGPAFRAAIAYALDNGISSVIYSGEYKVTSNDSVGYVLPFDDGTIDPVRVSLGQDTVLEAEEQITIPVRINLDANVSLIAGTPDAKIDFGWDLSTVDLNQAIGICVRVNNWDGSYIAAVGAVNRMMSSMTGGTVSGTITNAFIPILTDGVQQFNNWDNLTVLNSAFSYITQGMDRCSLNIVCRAVYVPPIVGGFWLQRNDVNFRGGTYIPPYVAGTPIYSVGWCDNNKFNIMYQGRGSADTDTLYQSLDTYFDTYFWKTASAATRLSSKGPDRLTNSTLISDNPYRGVSGRALNIICRYNRDAGGNTLEFKSLYTPKVPIWVNPRKATDWANNLVITQAFIEQGGLYKKDLTSNTTIGGSNDYYAASADTWNTDRASMPYSVLEGPGVVSNVKFSNSIVTRLSEWGEPSLGMKHYDIAYVKDASRHVDGDFVRQQHLKGDDGTFRTLENMQVDLIQYGIPHIWSKLNTNPILYYKHIRKNFSYPPIIYNGTISSATEISPTSYRGTIELSAGTVKVKGRLVLPSDISSLTGTFYIGFRELNNYFPYESDEGKWSVSEPFLRIAAVTLTAAGVAKGNILRTIRTYVPSETARTQNNFMFKFGQNTSSDSVLWSDLTAGTIFSFEIEYDSDTSVFKFTG